ncbi:anthranilate synthase component I [Solibaculum mannosilyticum]|uniref:Anthranilate synthase component 1 n=1 Tax=Solibaculum mannosilyticum TaxID=2780922 RepID=A0A7I8CZI8_9FIRM|nr:anthranilate synthase component I [Solibaculum mannosilyticum]BCI59907.1 anthranilate synthase component 1 [Solibaculum mannosilyticum]
MAKPTLEQMKQLQGDYSVIPVCEEIYADVTPPIALLRRLMGQSEKCYLLESVEGGKRWGRYSFLGFDPLVEVICHNGTVVVQKAADDGVEVRSFAADRPMETLREVLRDYRSPKLEGMPPFTGGLVGYFSYRMVGYAEPVLKLRESQFNDYHLMLFDRVIAYDHLTQKILVVVNVPIGDLEAGYDRALKEIQKLIALIRDTAPLPVFNADEHPQFSCNVTKEEFCRRVEKTKGYITEGDIFQAVISRRFEADYQGSLLNTYRVLRTTNPSPYMFYIRTGDVEIAGTSPETLIKLQHGKLSTYPVAGTRPRGADDQEDAELERDLLSDEKELAEHNMLVDLARNDLGKISRFGSVKVKEYMQIHRYSQVMHIASIVEGDIRPDKDAADAIVTALPAGTLSGAPKIRACQIIDEVEGEPRGIYGGAIGYIDFSGNMDVCIAIRMAVKKDGKVTVQAGGGIVADSVPENEYQESANKARAAMNAVIRASEVNE